jgi:hypothetical protein
MNVQRFSTMATKKLLDFYANVFDKQNNLVAENVYVGQYKTNTWAMHKACAMYPKYHNIDVFVKN